MRPVHNQTETHCGQEQSSPAGQVRLGKVVFSRGMGRSSVNKSYSSDEKKLYGFNALLAEAHASPA